MEPVRRFLKLIPLVCLLSIPGFGSVDCGVAPLAYDPNVYLFSSPGLVVNVTFGKKVISYLLLQNTTSPTTSYSVFVSTGTGSFIPGGDASGLSNFLASVGCTSGTGSSAQRAGFHGSGPKGAATPVGPQTPLSGLPPVAGQAAELIAVGFFNGDNVLDSAVVTPGAGITVNLLNADGTLLSTAAYALPLAESSIVAADFNGDGILDLAVIEAQDASGQGNVAILLGNGDGTFATPANFPAGPALPLSIAVADFNGDGKLDLAIGNSPVNVDGSVAVLLGNGDGTFAAPALYDVPQQPESMVAVDLNGDGNTDLAILDSGPGSLDLLQVLLGKGDGTFMALAPVSTGTGLGYLSYTDLNHDGFLDLLIVDPASSGLVFLPGNGDGTFQSPQSYLAAAGADSIALMPLLDGNTAMMIPDDITGTINLYIADATGNIGSSPIQTLGLDPGGIAAGDLNGDQQMDLVVSDALSGNISVLLNAGQGQFQSAVAYPLGLSPGAVALADFNHDGFPDVVAADFGGIDVMLGKGDGTLAPVTSYAGAPLLNSLALADFNGDGNLDVASVDSIDGNVVLFLGNGDGTFQAASTIPLPNAVVLLTVVSGDFNGDGKPDLAVAYNQTLPAGVSFTLPPGGIYILLGNGDGTFSTPTNITLPGFVLYQSGQVTAADLNADGILDLVAAFEGPNGNQVAALLGNGDGTFHMATSANTLTVAATIAITDLNGDGIPDLVLGDCCGLSEASYLIGNGDGTFQAEAQFASGPSPGLLTAADFNGDGMPDLAIAGFIQMPAKGTLTVLINGFTKP